jgi:hypothetical protein
MLYKYFMDSVSVLSGYPSYYEFGSYGQRLWLTLQGFISSQI